jgi:hypothetical protein
MTSYGGFQWPTEGKVTAPDWNPEPKCGGLHGLLNGQGDAGLLDWSPEAVWVVARPGRLLVDIDGQKVKCETATVVYAGDRPGALAVLRAAGVTDPLPGDVVTSGYRGTSTSGYHGQSTSGDYGTSTSGNYGQSTSGNYGQSTSGYGGQSTSGYRGTSTSGNYGTSTSGYRGQSTSGNYGRSTSGYRGQSTSGNYGRSTSGDGGQSTSGNYGTSTSGNYGQSTSGDYGTLAIRWWDGNRYRLAVAYVGEDGIEPNVAYKLDDAGRFVKVTA